MKGLAFSKFEHQKHFQYINIEKYWLHLMALKLQSLNLDLFKEKKVSWGRPLDCRYSFLAIDFSTHVMLMKLST